MQDKKRIGILGGSFNPIQMGHLAIANYLVENKISDEVWFMPCKVHPLNKNVIPENYRVDMINLAIKNHQNIKLCDLELKKSETSYTYQTLRELKKIYNQDFSWIIGSDILLQMNEWHGREILQKEAKFIVFTRPGYKFQNPGMQIEKIIDDISIEISSTQIRNRIKNDKSISDLVPKSVEEYILRNGLYRN